MAVVVYVWDPKLKVQFFAPPPIGSSSASVGHAALWIGRHQTYVSFRSGMGAGGRKWSLSLQEDYDRYAPSTPDQVCIEGLDEAKMVSWYKRMREEVDPTYFFFGRFFGHNCASMVVMALRAGGSQAREKGIYKASFMNMIWTPLDCLRYARSLV